MALHNTHSPTKAQAQGQQSAATERSIFPTPSNSTVSHAIEVVTHPYIIRATNLNPGEVIYFDLLSEDKNSTQEWRIHGKPVVISEDHPMQWVNFTIPFRLRSTGGANGGTTAVVIATADMTSHEKHWDLVNPCCEEAPVVDLPDAEVYVFKSLLGSNPTVGTPSSFTITIPYDPGVQGAPNPLPGVIVTDVMPANFTVTSITHNIAGPAPTQAQLAAGFAVPPLGPGSPYIISVNGSFNSAGAGTNTASLQVPATIDNVLTGINAIVSTIAYTVALAPVNTFTVQKTGPATAQLVSGPYTYTVVVTNNGSTPTGATSVLTDVVNSFFSVTSITSPSIPPAQIPTLSQLGLGWVMPSIPAGGNITLNVNGDFLGQTGNFTNTATVVANAPDVDSNTVDNTSTVNTFVSGGTAVNIGLIKTMSPVSVSVGDPVTFNIGIQNAGATAAPAGSITLQDILPSNFTATSIGSPFSTTPTQGQLAAGWLIPDVINPSAGPFPITFSVGGFFTSAGSFTNTASASVAGDTNLSDNTATFTGIVNVQTGDLAVTKQGAATTVVGASYTYTLALNFVSASAIPAGAVISDALPGSFTVTGITTTLPVAAPTQAQLASGWALPSVPPGVYTIDVTGSFSSPGNVSNSVLVTPPASFNDSFTANNSSTLATVVSAATNVDLGTIIATTNQNPNVGDSVNITLRVQNFGTSPSTAGAVLTWVPAGFNATTISTSAPVTPPTQAQLVAGWAMPSIPAGTFYDVGLIGTFATSGPYTTISSIVAVVADGDLNLLNNTALLSGTVGAAAGVDLGVLKTSTLSSPTVGQSVSFTIRVQNFSATPSTAGAVLTDVLPANFTVTSISTSAPVAAPSVAALAAGWPMPSIPPSTFYDVGVVGSFASPGAVSNTATIAVATPDVDGNAANDSSTVNLTVVPVTAPVFSVNKVGPSATSTGVPYQYSITVLNSGSAGGAVTLQDILPIDFTFSAISAVHSSLGAVGISVAALAAGWATPNLNPTETVVVFIDGSFTAAGSIVNTASLSSGPTSSLTTTVSAVGGADFAVAKSGQPVGGNVGDPVANNAAYTYFVTVTNVSASGGTVLLTDALPSSFVVTGISADLGSLGGFGFVVPSQAQLSTGWTTPNIPPTEYVGLIIDGFFGTPGTETNTAALSGDVNAANDVASFTQLIT